MNPTPSRNPARALVASLRRSAAFAIRVASAAVAGVRFAGRAAGAPGYLRRFVAWGPQGQADWRRLPARDIAPADEPRRYGPPLSAESAVSTTPRAGGAPRGPALERLLVETGTLAFLMVRDGRLLRESYFNGHSRDAMTRSFSVSKSYISALTGIALAEGRLGGLDDRLAQHVPELAGRGYDGITVEHLLAMTGGFRFTSSRYPWSDGLMVARHPDLRRLILEGPPLVAAPGERFGYSDYSTVLLGMVLQRVTKMTLTGYFERVLWRPMGAEFGALWSMDHAGAGLEQAHCGLTARAIDLVKLGSIYLERGHWLGRQVIPAAWVDRSVSPPGADVPGLSEEQRASGTYYALGWWGQRCSDGSDPFYAHGMNGQIVFVHPGKRLVIARFGQRAGEVPGGWPGLLRAMAEDEA